MNLIDIAKLTDLAYEINSQIEADKIEDKTLFKHVRFYKNIETDAEFICFENEKCNKVLVFKGTNSKKDFKYDLDFLPFELLKETPGSKEFKLHGGFYQQFLSLKDYFEKELDEYEHVNIILTGHSLGAALATIASIYMFCYVPSLLNQIVLFGSPRVLCTDFSNWYEKRLANKLIQVKDIYDPVCHLPPTGYIFQYQHVNGTVIKFKNGNIIKNETNLGFLKGMYDSCKGIVFRGCQEHKMINYLTDLESHSLFEKIILF